MKPEVDQTGAMGFGSVTHFASGFGGAELYRENSFRLAELGVEATDREFKRRIEMVEGAESIRVAPPPGPGRAFPLRPAPDASRLREVFQRLSKDPEQRLVEGFFWFWSETPGEARSDDALLALARGDADRAVAIWEQRTARAETRLVAEHNLAVIDHLRVVESEAEAPHERWRASLERWRKLCATDAFWSQAAGRILPWHDPRLRPDAGRRLREWLPRGLLTVNARLAARAIAEECPGEVACHLAAIRGAGFDQSVVDEVLAVAAGPARDQMKNLCSGAKRDVQARPESGRAVAQRLFDQARRPLNLLDAFLAPGDPTRKAARDEVAEQMRHVMIGYTNRTDDWSGAEPLLVAALKLAVTAQTRERIEKDLNVVRGHAKESNWWHGPGYSDLPSPIVLELDRAEKLTQAGEHEEAIRIVAGILSGTTGLVLPDSGRQAVQRTLAFALNLKSVKRNNAALAEYNEDPPLVVRFHARREKMSADHERGRTDYAFWESAIAAKEGTAAGCQNLHCMVCGNRIVQSFNTYTWGGFKVVGCPECAAKIAAEFEGQKATLRRAIPTPLLEAVLAAELNPSSQQLQENLKIIKERATMLGVPIPADSLALRLQLGMVGEDELDATARSWFSPHRTFARQALRARFPKRFQAFRRAHRTRVSLVWSALAASLAGVIALVIWTHRPATLALSVVGAPAFELLANGRLVSLASESSAPKFSPGHHDFVIKAAGFRPVRRVVELPAGEVVPWQVELVPEAGSIRPLVRLSEPARPANLPAPVPADRARPPLAPSRVFAPSPLEREIAQQVTWIFDDVATSPVDGVFPTVKPGRHQLEARHPHYNSTPITVEVQDQKTVDATIGLQLKLAKINIDAAKFADAELVVDGRSRGMIGASPILEFEAGHTYQLMVEKSGYRTGTLKFEATPGGEGEWKVELEPEHGEIIPTVTVNRQAAPPGIAAAVVWTIDDRVVPLENGRLARIPAGLRRIIALHPDYEAASGHFTVRDGEILRPTANLIPKPGSVRLSVAGPASYSVSVNGALKAPVSGALTLTPGIGHKVTIRAPGYFAVERTFTLAPNGSEVWEVSLEPVPKPKEGDRWSVPGLNLAMVWLEPGEFTMGSAARGPRDEQPGTRVRLTRGFWLGKTEVTKREYREVMGGTSRGADDDALPVVAVSWVDAMAFCTKLTARERAAGQLLPGYAYTLPTEAQWEYACRAGTTGAHAGPLEEMAWFGVNSDRRTHSVATKRPNAWGLHDMHGNVWEWCLDRYGNYPAKEAVDPAGPVVGQLRVLRGGGYFDSAENCRSALRRRSAPTDRNPNLGFRLVLAPVR